MIKDIKSVELIAKLVKACRLMPIVNGVCTDCGHAARFCTC